MSHTLIIGAGGVSTVATIKCAMNIDIFKSFTLASRTETKCQKIASLVKEKTGIIIKTAKINANCVSDLVTLIKKEQPKIVINLALPYQDLTIMDACIQTGVDYLDTANYEHPDEAKFEYKQQWQRDEVFKKRGIFGLLGSGFDPGVTNIFCAYAQKHLFDEIHNIDILDCNAGEHSKGFATNFNPEINLREVSAKGRYWEKGHWIETEPLAIKTVFNYPEIGPKDSYLLYHEELESLSENIHGLKRIRFFMTFGQSYITHMNCLKNVGMLGIEPIEHQGHKIIPIEFLKTLLPDPASLGQLTKGKTNIGCIFGGLKKGKHKKYYIYNVCDHQECFKEAASQAVSYTTGVPAMIGAKLILEQKWGSEKGVFNMEQNDPDFFMEELKVQGLPWVCTELDVNFNIGV